jgi:hypothetical protein
MRILLILILILSFLTIFQNNPKMIIELQLLYIFGGFVGVVTSLLILTMDFPKWRKRNC